MPNSSRTLRQLTNFEDSVRAAPMIPPSPWENLPNAAANWAGVS